MRLPRFDGANLTALKWVALVAMTAGHVDQWLFGNALGLHVTLGRLAFPLFALVLGYNLARPTVVDRLPSILLRVVVFAVALTPVYAYLTGAWLPLGILATIAVVVAVIWLHERGREGAAAVLLLVAPLFVDYGHVGVVAMLTVWAAYRFGPGWLLGVIASLVALSLFNGNAWALAAVPVAAVVLSVPDLRLPRTKWGFYAYYAGHLVVLAAIKGLAA